jgi:NTE family protein
MLKVVNLALQGGGSHGAFTWGVLDRLLEEERVSFEGITATSAGAVKRSSWPTVSPPAAARGLPSALSAKNALRVLAQPRWMAGEIGVRMRG